MARKTMTARARTGRGRFPLLTLVLALAGSLAIAPSAAAAATPGGPADPVAGTAITSATAPATNSVIDLSNDLIRSEIRDAPTYSDESASAGERAGTKLLAPAASASVSGVVTGPTTCAASGSPYGDVSAKHPRCNDIMWLRGSGLIGPPVAQFGPQSTVSRATLMLMLFRLQNPGKSAPACTSKPFGDVPITLSTCSAIAWAKAAGIASAGGGGAFLPGKAVTHAEVALFVRRAVTAKPAPACAGNPYSDVAKGSSTCPMIAWAKGTLIGSGMATGTQFGPGKALTRAELAAVLRITASRTAIAPRVTKAVLGPLKGATVLVRAADSSGRYYLATTSASGGYKVSGIVPGSYRICVDGSTISTRLASGYADRCLGGVNWAYDNPLAPVDSPIVKLAAAKSVSGLSVALSLAPAAWKGRRGPAPKIPALKTGFAYVDTNENGAVTYSPAFAIHYVVNDAQVPAGAENMITEAVISVARATGLRFIYDGVTSEKMRADTQGIPIPPAEVNIARYGNRWSPMVIDWSDVAHIPSFESVAIGWGGSRGIYQWSARERDWREVFVAGNITLDADRFAENLANTNWPNVYEIHRAVIMHELGHVVGLQHVNTPGQIMNPSDSESIVFGAGDLAGLARVGNGPILTIDPPERTTS